MIEKKWIKVVPTPKRIKNTEKKVALLPFIRCEKKEWRELIVIFCECAKKIQNIPFSEGTGGVELCFDASLKEESYLLEIYTSSKENGVRVSASDYRGAAHGLASVLQLLDREYCIDECKIEDWPDKAYRGLMVDVARQWHPFRQLLHYVDLCFYFKVKYLHLHFMDDQSYTLPSVRFPKLSIPGRSYSAEQIAELRAYAKARGVVLIPEIEMPGHARVLNQSYPESFSDQWDDTLVKNTTGKTITENGEEICADSIICAGSDKVFANVLTLIDETLELFPDSPYIHLGSDEVNHHVWEGCSHCVSYMKEHEIRDTKELYADFIGRVTDYVLQKGRTPIVWEGFAAEHAERISKDVIVISWENHYQTADSLLRNGFQIINCAWKPLYIVGNINSSQTDRFCFWDILDWNVYEWKHFWKESAAWPNPLRVEPTEQVLGAQVCIWGLTYEHEISRAVENIGAMSERVWNVTPILDDKQILDHMQKVVPDVFRLIAEQ